MTSQVMFLDPVTRWVRSLPGDYLLAREAAAALDMTVDRLKMLGRKQPDTLGPGHVAWMGEVMVYLYDQADLEQIRAYFAQLEAVLPAALDPLRAGRGRPPVWSPEEHADRHRRRALARYHRQAAAQFTSQDRPERAARSTARAKDIEAGLRAQRARRDVELNPDPAPDAPGSSCEASGPPAPRSPR